MMRVLLLAMLVLVGAGVRDMPVVYHSERYGLTFDMPAGWRGYSVMMRRWAGRSHSTEGDGEVVREHGRVIVLRHPGWKASDPYHDIPIYVFTRRQWVGVQRDGFGLIAGGVECEVAHNDRYVFAVWSRFNFDDGVKGAEEVGRIVEGNSVANEPHLEEGGDQ
ncbi:MAG TPA: hypothetical protein VFE58_15140 [Tepidisphaeraceae bacterium]|jgi:hypothetical protein|nr:hypothetical protein [Tepidisphaeraceae bacterium]